MHDSEAWYYKLLSVPYKDFYSIILHAISTGVAEYFELKKYVKINKQKYLLINVYCLKFKIS